MQPEYNKIEYKAPIHYTVSTVETIQILLIGIQNLSDNFRQMCEDML